MFTLIMFILAIAFIVWFSVALTKGWNKQAARRRAGAEAQAARHGGQFVREGEGPRAQGGRRIRNLVPCWWRFPRSWGAAAPGFTSGAWSWGASGCPMTT